MVKAIGEYNMWMILRGYWHIATLVTGELLRVHFVANTLHHKDNTGSCLLTESLHIPVCF